MEDVVLGEQEGRELVEIVTTVVPLRALLSDVVGREVF